MRERHYELTINGFTIDAVYDEEDIQDIFLPLLHTLRHLQQQVKRRILVFLVAPPAVGKSTLAKMLVHLAKTMEEPLSIQDIGLDGFHYPQCYLTSHTMVQEHIEIPLADVKGCPETFDVKKLRKALERMRHEDILWPIYDRNLHDVIEDQIQIKEDILILEGNWLLLQEAGWKELAQFCDYSIFISAEEAMLKERLIQRKMKGGSSLQEAVNFYEQSDGKNVKRVLQHSTQADLMLTLSANKKFHKEEM